MHKLMIRMIVLAALPAPILAAPPVYRDGEVTLDQVMIVRDGEGSYYRDVRFRKSAEGAWHVIDATAAQLATVQQVSVVAEDMLPPLVTVTLDGYKSLPCVELEPVGISREGRQFHIVLAETQIPPYASCLTVIDPFTLSFELNTRGLAPGVYEVIANGVATEFTLPAR